MNTFGCVHLLAGVGDVNDWCCSFDRHGWTCVLQTHLGPTRRLGYSDLPQCLVIDLDLAQVETLAQVCESPMTPPILAIADLSRLPAAIASLRLGVWDVVLKPVDIPLLVTKVSRALDCDRRAQSTDRDWRVRCQSLSAREHDVMQLLLEAYNMTQISKHLGISIKTAEKHRLSIFKKLNVRSVIELMRLVFQMLIRVPVAAGRLRHLDDAA